MSQFVFMIVLMGGLMLILWLSEYLHKTQLLRTEYTRKLAHVLGSLSSLIFIYIFDSFWYVVGIGVFFFSLLLIGKRKSIFNSIDGIKRKSSGSFLLPIAICGLFIVANVKGDDLLFVLPILVLGISDSLAGVFGIRFEQHTSKVVLFGRVLEKTYLGSAVFFWSALLISIAVLNAYHLSFAQATTLALVIAISSMIVELISTRGFDNIWVPLVVLITLMGFG